MYAVHRSISPVVVIAIITAIAASVAQASSPAAWAQLEKDSAKACATASDLKDPVVHPKTVLFDDTVGMDARLVTGTWRPAHMKGAKAVMLCLYDRRARRATAQDIEVWRGALPAAALPAPGKTAPVRAPAAPPKPAAPRAP